MDSENENRPLLHSFERETWRSRLRKRCFRMPSEITLTGIILGLFLIVVASLIVLENLQSSKKTELEIDHKLLGSPFKFNKKATDKSWQEKKDYMKTKNSYKDRKWDKVNKSWKQVPDPSGVLYKRNEDDLNINPQEEQVPPELPDTYDKYGKEIDDSREIFLQQAMGDPNATRDTYKEEREIMISLFGSNIKWRKIDDGWKKLSAQGWKDKDIRNALFKALKERKDLLKESDGALQSPMNLDEIWYMISENWKKNLDKGGKQQDKQKGINDDWKSKMNILQSTKESDVKWNNVDNEWIDSFKQGGSEIMDKKSINREEENMGVLKSAKGLDNKWKKVDDVWKKLNDQERKNKEIKDALIKAWKERENTMQSPMNFNDLWGKTVGLLKNLIDTGSDKAKSQQSINDKFANGVKILQSPKSANNKWKKEDYEKKSQKDTKNEETEEALIKVFKETENFLQVPDDFQKFLDKVIQTIRELQSNQSNSEENENVDENSHNGDNLLQSSMPFGKKNWKEVDDSWQKPYNQGWKDKGINEALDNAWKKRDEEKSVQSATGYGSMKWKKVNDGWKKISNNSANVPTRFPISNALLLRSPVLPSEIDCALIAENVRRKFGECIDMSFLPTSCKPSWRTKCFSSYKYRKTDGTCNNKIHPTWGKSGTAFVRMIAPDYADGVSAIRTAKNGEPLPNARLLSRKLYLKRMNPDGDTSVLFLYFGLIVDHDMVETGVNAESIPCCNEDFQVHPQSRPKECLQIDVPSDDPFYGPRNVRCLNLVRSFPINGACPGRREQLNKATSYLDGSAVYGSSIQHAKTLRAFSRGQLRTQLINNRPFMAVAKGAGFNCGTPKEPLQCFEAGDTRANMMVELTAMHTIWYREHNRLATELLKLNPQWTDEMIFQEARRILIGELQHITYNEFLPLLLGEKAENEYELKIDESKRYDGYDDTVDASVFNVFASAAFEFGQSLAPDMQYLLGANNSTASKVVLHDTFFNANLLYHNGLDLLLRGAATQRTQSVDSYITPELREHLFQPADLDYGHDLAAVSIQKGRDHGLPPYTKWRSVCGLPEVKTWDDLYKIMDKERADMFKEVYSSVEDIDLIPGALAELHEAGSLVGPTYTCLIGRQFKKTRKGDRFWYEIQNEIGSFTKGQLDQIYKSNMARIICDNSDDIKLIQRHPFKVPSDHNVLLDCSAIPKVDLSEWSLKY